jgi:uncharacterized membrane protein YsdA (DUF1294 family)
MLAALGLSTSYLSLCLNLLAFLLSASDKLIARSSLPGLLRVSERSLCLLAFLGALPGLLLSFLLFRHKTRKVSFHYKLLLALAARLLLRSQLASYGLL